MRKVLIFTTAYHPYIGGAELAVAEITKRLASDNIFFLITYRFSRKDPAFEERDGMEIYRLGFGTVPDRWFLFPALAFFKALQIHRKHKVDLLWAVMVTYASIGAYFLKLIRPELPLLLTLQEGDPVEHLRFGKFGLLGVWWKLLVKKSDYIQAISKYLADYAASVGAKSPVAVVPNGVNFDHFSKPTPADVLEARKKRFGFRSEDFVLVTASRLVAKNAVDICIEALKKLPVRFKFLILGSGKDENDLKNLASKSGLSGRAVFAGEIPQAELPDYLHLADVFIRPSRSEGLGNAFLEAMAAGLPVVGTSEGGIPDFLKDGQTGLVCRTEDPDDLAAKIKRLSEDEALREAVSANGRELVKNSYSWEKISRSIEKIFSGISK